MGVQGRLAELGAQMTIEPIVRLLEPGVLLAPGNAQLVPGDPTALGGLTHQDGARECPDPATGGFP